MPSACQKRSTFSLTEMLVVVAILAILLSLLAPNLRSAYVIAQKTTCQNQLRALATGYHMYAEDFGDIYPYAKQAKYHWQSDLYLS